MDICGSDQVCRIFLLFDKGQAVIRLNIIIKLFYQLLVSLSTRLLKAW